MSESAGARVPADPVWTDSSAAALESARRSLYRPGAGEGERRRYDRWLQRRAALIASAEVDPSAEPRSEDEPRLGRASRRCDVDRGRQPTAHRRVPVAAAVVGALALAGGVLTVMALLGVGTIRTPTPPRIAQDLRTGSTLLPAAQRDWSVVASGDSLKSGRALTSDRGTALLLAVRCPTTDRSFEAQVTGGTSDSWQLVSGSCGRLRLVHLLPAGAETASVTVTTRGAAPFAAALLAPP